MTLVQAFLTLAPEIGDDEIDGHRRGAAALVRRVLVELARGIGMPPDRREDAVQDVLLRLTRSGPRLPEGAPDSEPRVRGYLRRSLIHALDDRGWELPEGLPGGALELADSSSGPEDEVLAREVLDLVVCARRTLYETIVAGAAAAMRDPFRPGFLAAIDDLRAMAAGRASFDDLVVARYGQSTTALRNRLYQQHCRARGRAIDALERWIAERASDEVRARALRWVADEELRARERAAARTI